jgi:tRNA modification GTPase
VVTKIRDAERLVPEMPIVMISALKGDGREDLREKIKEIFFNGKFHLGEDVIVTHERHMRFLLQASSNLEMAMEAIRRGESPEFVSIDLREALDSLDTIVGERVDEEILDRIFSNFCIGK